MKREELRKLGLTDEQIDSVMNIHGDDMNAQKATINHLNEQISTLTTERDGLKTQVSDRDNDIAELKKSAGDNEALTKQLTDLQTRYDTETTDLKKRLDDQARNFAVEALFNGVEFTSAFAKKAAIAEFKAGNHEFKDGKFTSGPDIIKKMQTDNPDAFKIKEEKKGKDDDPGTGGEKKRPTFTQPNTSGGTGGDNPFKFNFTGVRKAATTDK